MISVNTANNTMAAIHVCMCVCSKTRSSILTVNVRKLVFFRRPQINFGLSVKRNEKHLVKNSIYICTYKHMFLWLCSCIFCCNLLLSMSCSPHYTHSLGVLSITILVCVFICIQTFRFCFRFQNICIHTYVYACIHVYMCMMFLV